MMMIRSIAVPAIVFLTLGYSLANADVTLIADDFDGNTVSALNPSGGIDLLTVADPTDAGNMVGSITFNGGGQWQSLISADFPLPATTAAGIDEIKFSYRVYIPSEANGGMATIGTGGGDSDSFNSLLRINGTQPDAYPPSQQNAVNDFFALDQWVLIENVGFLPELDNTDDISPVTSLFPILSIRDISESVDPAPGDGGFLGYIDDISISVTESIEISLACDFNADLACDIGDLDDLYGNFGGAAIYDVDKSGTVDGADVGAWLAEASSPTNTYLGGTKTFQMGDVNLNGTVDSPDLGILLNNFDDTSGKLFGAGNLNDDPNVNSVDLGLMLNNFGFASAAASASVPEPGAVSLLLIAAAGVLGMRRTWGTLPACHGRAS